MPNRPLPDAGLCKGLPDEKSPGRMRADFNRSRVSAGNDTSDTRRWENRHPIDAADFHTRRNCMDEARASRTTLF